MFSPHVPSIDNKPAKDLNIYPVLVQLPLKISIVYISLQGYSYILMGQHVATGQGAGGGGLGGGFQCFPHKIFQHRKDRTTKMYFEKCSFPRLLEGHF